MLALIDTATPMPFRDTSEITGIINEEAESYYQGQKTVDEVVEIIQSRIISSSMSMKVDFSMTYYSAPLSSARSILSAKKHFFISIPLSTFSSTEYFSAL